MVRKINVEVFVQILVDVLQKDGKLDEAPVPVGKIAIDELSPGSWVDDGA